MGKNIPLYTRNKEQSKKNLSEINALIKSGYIIESIGVEVEAVDEFMIEADLMVSLEKKELIEETGRKYDSARRLLKTMQKEGTIKQSTFNYYWQRLADLDGEFKM